MLIKTNCRTPDFLDHTILEIGFFQNESILTIGHKKHPNIGLFKKSGKTRLS